MKELFIIHNPPLVRIVTIVLLDRVFLTSTSAVDGVISTNVSHAVMMLTITIAIFQSGISKNGTLRWS